jgi:hypothetical protein
VGRDGQELDTCAGLVALDADVACDGCNQKLAIIPFEHVTGIVI